MIEKICNKITEKIREKIEMTDERAEVINFGLLVIIGEVPKIIIIMLIAWYLNI